MGHPIAEFDVPFADYTGDNIDKSLGSILSDKDVVKGFQLGKANVDAWSKDNIIKADYLLDLKSAVESGKLREKTLENGIVTDIREKCSELNPILVKEYGRDWNVRAPESVLMKAWELSEAVKRREVHGYDVNQELRPYLEKPQFNKDGGERIYFPEDKNERRKLLGKAKYYNEARIDARSRMLDIVDLVRDDRDYANGSYDAELLRIPLAEAWIREDKARVDNCVYELDYYEQRLKLSEVNSRIERGDVPELATIAKKIRTISHVSNEDDLLHEIGIGVAEGEEYKINWPGSENGISLLVKGRMGQQELMQIWQKCADDIEPGSEENADIMLMNAIGMQELSAMEVAGKSIIEGEIYRQRGIELNESIAEDRERFDQHLNRDESETGMTKDQLAQYLYEAARQINDVLYKISASMTNAIRFVAIDNGGKYRGVAEKVSSWIDRLSSWGAPKMDKYLAKKTNTEPRNLSESDASLQRGRVSFNLPSIEEV